MGNPTWTDAAITAHIGTLLRAGVLASAVFLLVGGAMHLYYHGDERAVDRSTFDPTQQPREFTQPGAIVRAAIFGRVGGSAGQSTEVPPGKGRGRALIQLGLLLLIATPVLRVAYCIFAFARQGNVVLVLLPSIVLVVLIYALFSGQVH